MSNLEEFGSSNLEDIKFIGEEASDLLPKETFNSVLGVESAMNTPTPKFVPPTLKKKKEDYEDNARQAVPQPTPEKEAQTAEDRIKALEDMIMTLREGLSGVKVVQSGPQRKLDFSQLSELDVYDLSTPIETIEHQYEDYSEIQLKDPNYIARWVNINPIRMGQMKVFGFTYVTEEDLASPLGMDLQLDENGVYRNFDVVAMKAPKEKYFKALRTNYLRALAQTQQKKVHELAQQVTEQAIMNGTADNKAPVGQAVEYQKRKAAGQLNIYSPNLT